MRNILIAQILASGVTQIRADDPGVVKDYAEAMKDGAIFPPVTVFRDGSIYYLADGHQRVKAAKSIGRTEIAAEVKRDDGETAERAAILYAVWANDAHGARRTNKDKRKAVRTLLEDSEWSLWSHSEIARQCRVSRGLVKELHGKSINQKCIEIADSSGSLAGKTSEESVKTYRNRHRSVSKMDTSQIGKTVSPEKLDQRTYRRLAGAFAEIDSLSSTLTGTEAFTRYGDQVSNPEAVSKFVAEFAAAMEKSRAA